LELYHDVWTCPMKHVSLEEIRKEQKLAVTIPHHRFFKPGSFYDEPIHVSNAPGVTHGSCWRVQLEDSHKLSTELTMLETARFTDAQLRTLVESRKVAYWSEDNQQWITHTFDIKVRQDCLEEVKESWHLRTVLMNKLGTRVAPQLPGVYLQNPTRWSPYVTLEPEHVIVGLQERDTKVTRENRVYKQHIALGVASEVREFLKTELEKLISAAGIVPNEELAAKIEEVIDDTIEIWDVREDPAKVEFAYAMIEQDAVGGNVLYVFLESDLETYKISITRHLHDIRQIGRIGRESFASSVRDRLGEFNLSKTDENRAVKECIRIMRSEKLIK